MDAGLEGPRLNARLMDTGVAATRQLAKRQITWLRSMQRIAIAADQPHATQEVTKCLAERQGSPRHT